MARGSSSGGHSSGGGFRSSGSHSSSGFHSSGGSRSSSSVNRGSRGSSSGGFKSSSGNRSNSGGFRPSGGYGAPLPPHRNDYGYPPPPPPPRYGGYYGGRRYRRSGGCLGGAIGMITALIVLVIIMILCFTMCTAGIFSGGSSGVTKSTYQREKLSSASCTPIDSWYSDEIGGLENRKDIEDGLKQFYSLTGIQPYVVVTDDLSIDEQYISNKYDEMFGKDSGHVLLYILIDGEGYDWEEYSACFEIGDAARAIFDSEAQEIFWDYLGMNWSNNKLNNAEFIGNTFASTADRMMNVTPNQWTKVVIAIVVLIALIVIFIWWKKVQAAKIAKYEHTEKVLNTDLDKFESEFSEAEQLAKKYEDT